jgi:hypothetical protein
MHNRLVLALLAAAVLAYACGPRVRSAQLEAAGVRHPAPALAASPLAASLDISTTDGVRFAFHVTNASDRKLEVRFPNGQTHDVVVLDSLGREIWRASEGRMFTQSLRNTPMDAGETVSWQDAWRTPPRGAVGPLTAVAVLTSQNYPTESRVAFRLGAP